MNDWTKDSQVIEAGKRFDESRARWLKIAPVDGLLRTDATEDQEIAFIEMRSADRAYEWARDAAIHRVMLNLCFEDVDTGWPRGLRMSRAYAGNRQPDMHYR